MKMSLKLYNFFVLAIFDSIKQIINFVKFCLVDWLKIVVLQAKKRKTFTVYGSLGAGIVD